MPRTTIRSIDCLKLRLPFRHGAEPPLFAGRPRTTLDSVLVRVELDNGAVGWGEAYGGELDALAAVLAHRVAPLACGRDALEPGLTPALERTLHNLGRSGVLLHALSGLDIALWDLRGKLEGVPLHALLGGAKRQRIPAYASLLQYYGDAGLVACHTARALEDGFGRVKLHERTAAAVAAARRALGPGLPLMVDTNCAWQLDEAVRTVREMAPFDPLWIEEPLWPPEDGGSLAALRAATGIPVAVGENASSLFELQSLVANAGVDYLQPSAIKCGGVTALWQLARQCEGTAVRFSPQSAFFGPGFLATLHVLAAQEAECAVERLYCELGAVPYGTAVPLQRGHFTLTDRPGLGADPEPALIDGPFVSRP
ncbi:mandelate racemase/muconate lactonizing enzyme family protein [Aquincola sp. MAHUQ-54]|uniref:Mandelate racemase/muconate lactonizing enzyme family protein n=1 Tax=Aquincola agrisoli TaxID=3119538 RepID=A0AAW9QFV5_9BURK